MTVRVAVIPGDGVGPEVIDVAVPVRNAVATELTNLQHHTRDLGGTATTADLATAVLRQMETTS